MKIRKTSLDFSPVHHYNNFYKVHHITSSLKGGAIMATANARFTLSVSEDIVKQAEVLKKEIYFDKPYAEMYRQLIRLGMNVLKTEQSRKSSENNKK